LKGGPIIRRPQTSQRIFDLLSKNCFTSTLSLYFVKSDGERSCVRKNGGLREDT
jgi:hypothetical protein